MCIKFGKFYINVQKCLYIIRIFRNFNIQVYISIKFSKLKTNKQNPVKKEQKNKPKKPLVP